MANYTGPQTAVGTSSGLESTRRVIDMKDSIALLEPSAAPLTVFQKRAGSSESCFNPEYKWHEDALAAKAVTLDATGYNNSVTTVNVASGEGLKITAGDLIKVPSTGEILLVSAVATDALTVVRGFGTTAGATIPASEVVLVIGNANKENAASRDVKATTLVPKTNYAQIFRTSFGFSRTAMDSKLYGGKVKAYEANKKGIEHKVEMERQFMFGEPKEQINADGGRWQTGGLDYWIQTNRINAGGSVTYAGLENVAETLFRYGNQSSRLGLASPSYITKIDLLSEAKLFFQSTTTVYGVRVNRVQTSHGDLMLVKHPLLAETAAYNERCFYLDMDKVKLRPFVNADTQLRKNIQTNDLDGEKHEYLTQIGLQVENELCHGIHYGAA